MDDEIGLPQLVEVHESWHRHLVIKREREKERTKNNLGVEIDDLMSNERIVTGSLLVGFDFIYHFCWGRSPCYRRPPMMDVSFISGF